MHLMNTLENGLNSIVVRTVDTDVMVVLISEFHAIHKVFPEADIWIAFGTGKNSGFTTVCGNLGRDKSHSLPTFHAFTGCDTSFSFFGKTKKSAWEAWNLFSVANEAFLQPIWSS